MMFWMDYRNAKMRHEEFLRQAERRRLARQALSARRTNNHPSSRILTKLGQRLIAWGSRLQEHYGSEPTTLSNPQMNPR
jgi:hypothetical protein